MHTHTHHKQHQHPARTSERGTCSVCIHTHTTNNTNIQQERAKEAGGGGSVFKFSPTTSNLILTCTCKISCAPYQWNEQVGCLHIHNPPLPFSYSHAHALTPADFLYFCLMGCRAVYQALQIAHARTHTHTHTHTHVHIRITLTVSLSRTSFMRIFGPCKWRAVYDTWYRNLYKLHTHTQTWALTASLWRPALIDVGVVCGVCVYTYTTSAPHASISFHRCWHFFFGAKIITIAFVERL